MRILVFVAIIIFAGFCFLENIESNYCKVVAVEYTYGLFGGIKSYYLLDNGEKGKVKGYLLIGDKVYCGF